MRNQQFRSMVGWAAVVCVTVGLKGMAQEPGLPVTYVIPDATALVDAGWGPASAAGAIKYRPALKGKSAMLRIPNWWGGASRPPQGKVYVLEVSYQDTVATPAVAEAFANVAAWGGRSELHRFGGAHDGQWKVAQIPVSWDLVMLPKGRTTTEFAFKASEDLPVSRIVIREAKLPQDQARYEAESRAWIAQAQADKAASAGQQNKKEAAGIPPELKSQDLIAYVRPYYEHIFPNSAPQTNEIGQTIHIRMARNEYEPGGFGVYAQRDCTGVTYQVSELTGPGGKLACELKLLTAEYALDKGGKDVIWWPQRLWPVYPANLRQGQSLWCFFTVRTLGEASKPGVYGGKVTITAGAQHVDLPVRVEVQPITLLTMDECGLLFGGCCSGFPSDGELQTMAEHNHNMVNLWFAGARPVMKRVGDQVELDFTYMDEWMKMARRHGIRKIVWFLGGNPNGYPETLSIERDLYEVRFGSKTDYFKKVASEAGRGKIPPELVPVYTKWVQDVVVHARQNDWPELIFTPFDEPAKWASSKPYIESGHTYAIGCGPWIRDHFKAACQLLHDAVPGLQVYASIHQNNVKNVQGYKGRIGEIFLPDIDIFCTNAIDEDEEMGNKVRKAGKQFWQYGGGRSRRYGVGFYFASYNSRGSLKWAYNWGSRFDTSTGSNWEYGWYSPFGTIVTPDYELFREALDDRRYMETARTLAKAKGVDIAPLIDKISKEVIADRGNGGRDKVNDFWEEGRTASKMDYWRKLLADKILELNGK